jgi:lipopolysaccharide transport system permease protein
MAARQESWDLVITPRRGLLDLRLSELWHYRYLIWMYVKRDFASLYKQTILGPLWYLIQPLFTTVVFTVVFSDIAQLSTDGLPPFLFYLAGNTLWIYFSSCLNNTADTFRKHLPTYNKVYFPRLSIPLSVTISSLVSLGIRLVFFLSFLFYFIASGRSLQPNAAVFLLPLLLAVLAALSLGAGLLITAVTVKYRDLQHLTAFGVQLLMYATPIIYPLSTIESRLRWLVLANPITPVIEAFRFGFLGVGTFTAGQLAYSFLFAVGLFFLALVIFNQAEGTFVDTA